MQNPVVSIRMKNGKVIKIELYPDVAPNTVNNFIYLVKRGFYDDLTFHRVIRGFMIQGGDPNGTGTGGPRYRIKGEFSANGVKNDLKHTRGVVIMHGDAPHLDGQYAAFGKVIEGMDAVDEIASGYVDYEDRPQEEQVMKKVTVETFGTEYPEPEKL